MQHFPAEVIRKGIPDQTECTLMDLDTMDYYDRESIKSERDRVEMYIGQGWYEYAKEKNLRWEIFYFVTTTLVLRWCTSGCGDVSKGTMLEENYFNFIWLYNYYYWSLILPFYLFVFFLSKLMLYMNSCSWYILFVSFHIYKFQCFAYIRHVFWCYTLSWNP